MMGAWYWLVVVLFMLHLQQPSLARKVLTCGTICRNQGIDNGCRYGPDARAREEVIVVTNGSSDIGSWRWDTITMVVSSYFSSGRNTGLVACYTHSMGKRYGLRELVPTDTEQIMGNTDKVKEDFKSMILTYQKLLVADHIVYDLLEFFSKTLPATQNQSEVMSKMTEILSFTIAEVASQTHHKEVYCIVPWQPPCDSDCSDVRDLLRNCDVLVMSPDSYMPVAPSDDGCLAQATVPISKFLYGVDRYIALREDRFAVQSIVAGIPWHGFTYQCDEPISNNLCIVRKKAGQPCFNSTNREKRTLSDIHKQKFRGIQMDEMSKAVFYNSEQNKQLWFENYTTLLFKYQLVQDLKLRGLSIWNGEDLAVGMARGEEGPFHTESWNFLTHHVLHKAVYNKPVEQNHHYADTVVGVAIGCLLLGTALGVIFTCIGFRRSEFRKLKRPFKLDEDEGDFRDDEGL